MSKLKTKKFEVISVDAAGRWLEILEKVKNFDFYHLPAYHKIEQRRVGGIGQLLYYERNDALIAIPILMNSLSVPLGSGSFAHVKDVTSVYGYPGPICSNRVEESDLSSFSRALQDYLVGEDVVCAFSRLHPLLIQVNA